MAASNLPQESSIFKFASMSYKSFATKSASEVSQWTAVKSICTFEDASARSRSIVLIRIHNATCWRNHTRNPTWLFGPWMRLHFLSIAYNPELMKGTNQWRWLDNDQPWAPPNLKLQRKHSLQLTLALVIDVGYENQWVKANWVLGILQADWKAYVFCTFESIYTNMLQWVQSVSTWSCAL